MRLVLLAGGLGGARLAPALARVLGADRLTVIANVGDDLEWMGLRVCPDLDSITYALAGLWDRDRGWGRLGETFRVGGALARLGVPSWFAVGDLDLALHLERARLLRGARSLTAVTRTLARKLAIEGVTVLPASDSLAATRLRLQDGRVLDFQEWYVRERARPRVRETLLARAPAAGAALRALAAADAVVLAPSNPITSIGAILALRGMRRAVRAVPRRLAVSPVVIGRRHTSASITQHARARAKVLRAEGSADRPGAIARRYAGLVECFLIDRSDAAEAEGIRRRSLEVVLSDVLDDDALAATVASVATESHPQARARVRPRRPRESARNESP